MKTTLDRLSHIIRSLSVHRHRILFDISTCAGEKKKAKKKVRKKYISSFPHLSRLEFSFFFLQHLIHPPVSSKRAKLKISSFPSESLSRAPSGSPCLIPTKVVSGRRLTYGRGGIRRTSVEIVNKSEKVNDEEERKIFKIFIVNRKLDLFRNCFVNSLSHCDALS